MDIFGFSSALLRAKILKRGCNEGSNAAISPCFEVNVVCADLDIDDIESRLLGFLKAGVFKPTCFWEVISLLIKYSMLIAVSNVIV